MQAQPCVAVHPCHNAVKACEANWLVAARFPAEALPRAKCRCNFGYDSRPNYSLRPNGTGSPKRRHETGANYRLGNKGATNSLII